MVHFLIRPIESFAAFRSVILCNATSFFSNTTSIQRVHVIKIASMSILVTKCQEVTSLLTLIPS